MSIYTTIYLAYMLLTSLVLLISIDYMDIHGSFLKVLLITVFLWWIILPMKAIKDIKEYLGGVNFMFVTKKRHKFDVELQRERAVFAEMELEEVRRINYRVIGEKNAAKRKLDESDSNLKSALRDIKSLKECLREHVGMLYDKDVEIKRLVNRIEGLENENRAILKERYRKPLDNPYKLSCIVDAKKIAAGVINDSNMSCARKRQEEFDKESLHQLQLKMAEIKGEQRAMERFYGRRI